MHWRGCGTQGRGARGGGQGGGEGIEHLLRDRGIVGIIVRTHGHLPIAPPALSSPGGGGDVGATLVVRVYGEGFLARCGTCGVPRTPRLTIGLSHVQFPACKCLLSLRSIPSPSLTLRRRCPEMWTTNRSGDSHQQTLAATHCRASPSALHRRPAPSRPQGHRRAHAPSMPQLQGRRRLRGIEGERSGCSATRRQRLSERACRTCQGAA